MFSDVVIRQLELIGFIIVVVFVVVLPLMLWSLKKKKTDIDPGEERPVIEFSETSCHYAPRRRRNR